MPGVDIMIHRKLTSIFRGLTVAAILLWAQTSFAWDWNAPARGWVDVIYNYCDNQVCFGPLPPAKVNMHGWVCPSPSVYNSPGFHHPSTSVLVYQGGPAGQGGVLLDVSGITTEDRPDTVIYGACANQDSGFNIWFNPRTDLPRNFYVYYYGQAGWIVLEGQSVYSN